MWNHPSRRYLTPRICGDLSEHMNLNCNIWDLNLKATLVNVYQAVVKNDCWHPAASCILSPIYCCVDLRVTESRRSVMTALYVLEITILLCVKKYIELLYWLLYYFLFMKRNAMYYYKNKCNIISNLLILYWYFVFCTDWWY